MAFLPQNIKKSLLWAVFQEALMVAPLFLDMCLDIYGAWINPQKYLFGIFVLENIAFLKEKGF